MVFHFFLCLFLLCSNHQNAFASICLRCIGRQGRIGLIQFIKVKESVPGGVGQRETAKNLSVPRRLSRRNRNFPKRKKTGLRPLLETPRKYNSPFPPTRRMLDCFVTFFGMTTYFAFFCEGNPQLEPFFLPRFLPSWLGRVRSNEYLQKSKGKIPKIKMRFLDHLPF